MPDREKVIKGLEELCKKSNCPFVCFDALALLKKQEAVEPTIDEYGNKRCGSCGHKLQSIADPDLFCCKCGKPILWEGR